MLLRRNRPALIRRTPEVVRQVRDRGAVERPVVVDTEPAMFTALRGVSVLRPSERARAGPEGVAGGTPVFRTTVVGVSGICLEFREVWVQSTEVEVKERQGRAVDDVRGDSKAVRVF